MKDNKSAAVLGYLGFGDQQCSEYSGIFKTLGKLTILLDSQLKYTVLSVSLCQILYNGGDRKRYKVFRW